MKKINEKNLSGYFFNSQAWELNGELIPAGVLVVTDHRDVPVYYCTGEIRDGKALYTGLGGRRDGLGKGVILTLWDLGLCSLPEDWDCQLWLDPLDE